MEISLLNFKPAESRTYFEITVTYLIKFTCSASRMKTTLKLNKYLNPANNFLNYKFELSTKNIIFIPTEAAKLLNGEL